jgi:hypothetical protein
MFQPFDGGGRDLCVLANAVVDNVLVHETWNESAEDAVKVLFSAVRKNAKIELIDLRDEFDEFLENMYSVPGGHEHAAAMWVSIGADAIELAKKSGHTISESTLQFTLIEKQTDYGPENIKRFGRQGLMVRMHDKIARLENLLAAGRTPKNESIYDTYLDIAGYAAIGIMWETRTFLLPLRTPTP